jgi:hypothetical protein
MATITFNGQEYNSPDAMPPEVRRLYERARHANGGSRIRRQARSCCARSCAIGKTATVWTSAPTLSRSRCPTTSTTC